ncbi:TetR/AcrR family transcriptional regulator [Achromobacter pestifer]
MKRSDDSERRARIGEQKRAKTRLLLVEAAVQTIAERGFDTPTIDDFIAAANVARGTFYNHFPTREELLAAAAAHVADTIDAEILPLFSVVDDPPQRVAIAIRKFIALSMASPALGGLLVRMVLLNGAALSEEMQRGVLADLQEGAARGRFNLPSMQAGVAASLGTISMGIRIAINGDVPPDFPETIAAMILRSLGMTVKEAAKIAQLPFPQQPGS